jgi:hypothetical protein
MDAALTAVVDWLKSAGVLRLDQQKPGRKKNSD